MKRIDDETLVILFIEDNKAHADLVMLSFKDHQIKNKIIHLSDGELALDYLYNRNQFSAGDHARPDLILLDLRLPKVDGMEVLRQIKDDKDLRDIPVVILTTSASDRDVVSAYTLRANSYLVKPLDFDKFKELMNDLGHYWLGWNYHAVD